MKSKILLGLVLLLFAFTSISSIAAAKPVVNADTTYFDPQTGLYVLKGNVCIQVGRISITAGQAKVSMGSWEVWGSEGITLTYGNISLNADSTHVYCTQKRALIDGGVTLKQTGLTITADKADFDWGSKLAVFSNNVQVTQGDRSWSANSVTYNAETNSLQ